MISKIQAVDRMKTCDQRLLSRLEEAIDNAIIAAADRKRGSVVFEMDCGLEGINKQLIEKLKASGYQVFDVEGRCAVRIVWHL